MDLITEPWGAQKARKKYCEEGPTKGKSPFFSGENLMCINLLELTIVWFNFVIKISSKVDWVLVVLILLHRGLQSCIT